MVQVGGETVRVCRFSPDSTLLATAGDNGQVCLWDLIRRNLVRWDSFYSPDTFYISEYSTNRAVTIRIRIQIFSKTWRCCAERMLFTGYQLVSNYLYVWCHEIIRHQRYHRLVLYRQPSDYCPRLNWWCSWFRCRILRLFNLPKDYRYIKSYKTYYRLSKTI